MEIGLDVPWVTSWSGETLLGVGRCETVGGRAAIGQQHRPGQGRPQFSLNHYIRQRRSVREMLCPMCGSPTKEDDRWTALARRTTAGRLREQGFGHALPPALPDKHQILNAGSIAPCHRRCLDRSLSLCPHLRSAPTEVNRFPVRWTVSPLYVEALPIVPAIRPVPVISFLQILGVSDP